MKRLIYRVYKFLQEHTESCKFFDQFGLLIQACLGMMCLSALIFKRFMEKPRRPWIIWFFDTLKQVVGQFTQHFSNLLIASHMDRFRGYECEWYLNNLITDCSLGVLLCYLYLKLLLYMLKDTRLEFKTGDYGQGELDYLSNMSHDSNIHPKVTWKCKNVCCQILWWVLIVVVTKITILTLIFIFDSIFETLGKILVYPVKGNSKLKLIFVMIVYPTIFNIIQFWCTDNFIKNTTIVTPYATEENGHIESVEAIDVPPKEKGYTPLPTNEHNNIIV